MASDYDEFIYLDKYACEITIDKDKDKKTQLVLYFEMYLVQWYQIWPLNLSPPPLPETRDWYKSQSDSLGTKS